VLVFSAAVGCASCVGASVETPDTGHNLNLVNVVILCWVFVVLSKYRMVMLQSGVHEIFLEVYLMQASLIFKFKD
jgi:hypothetical protein